MFIHPLSPQLSPVNFFCYLAAAAAAAGWLVKVSCLGKLAKLASVFWWVELDFFYLECNEVSSNEL